MDVNDSLLYFRGSKCLLEKLHFSGLKSTATMSACVGNDGMFWTGASP